MGRVIRSQHTCNLKNDGHKLIKGMSMNKRLWVLNPLLLATALPAWAAAARNGVLNIAVQPEPPGLLLGIVQNGPTQMIGGNIYESLLRYDEKLEPMPGLAASWTVNDTATVYTFTLKQGVLWHDGKPFTAHDVVFSVDQFLRKTQSRLRAGLAFVDSIKALDDQGSAPSGNTPEEFAKEIKEQYDWAKDVVKKQNIKLD